MPDPVAWHREGERQPALTAEALSHWWALCHDCDHTASFSEPRVRMPAQPDEHGRMVDAGLLRAALDLAEHQDDTGHRRCVLWTGAAAERRGPTQAELGVCADHPAYVIPQWGGAWLSAAPGPDCVLVPRAFEYGHGRVLTRGYPVAVAAWQDPRHNAGQDITGQLVRNDDAQVCHPCLCVTRGPRVHSD